MLTLMTTIFSILPMTEFILGNFVNGFIVLVNCIDWVKRQKISSTDGILTALALSRIGLLWVILINWYAHLLNYAIYRIIAQIVWAISNHFSIWLATCLSIFYLLKIANFSNLVFLYLKWRVKSVLLVILLGSLVLLVSQLSVVIICESMLAFEYERNITWKTKLKNTEDILNTALFILTNFVPFAMSLMSFLLLIFSLWKHLKVIQLSGNGSQDPSTKVHIRAMQTVISFLLLFAIYILCLMISLWNNRLKNEIVFMISQTLGTLYPLSHSCILILGNKKLKKALLSVFWRVKNWLQD